MRADTGETAVVDASLADTGITTAAGAGFIDLSWESHGDTTRYAVVRDDQLLHTTQPDNAGYRDNAVVPGADHRYEIAPILEEDDLSEARSWHMQVTATGEDGTTTALHEQAHSQAVTAAASRTTTVSYITFIPQKRINAPVQGCGSYGSKHQFGGDNRTSFDWKSSRYRTAVHGTVNWNAKTVTSNVSIAPTKVYRKSDGKLVATKTASGKSSYAKKMSVGTTTRQDVRVVTHASNPFCGHGAISGAFSMNVTRSGNYSIFSGKHRQMPNTHVYIFNGTTNKATTVYSRKYASVACLVGPVLCREANFTGSGRY
ncbi:hypothetical protein [Streptomyces otsuchiensis]|uniref:hypothetical protein n=1 Tax=Streptomyces otsuchiensis TaxID=2681388 RepID=UPI0010316F83|nr:hypothetical protein [Streptomyces otsuchiensis]